MTGKEDQTLAKACQSDPGETEDEEVKRNCVMGESGMRDSDYFDSDSEEEQSKEEVHIDHKTKKSMGESSEEDRIVELVKFSQILKPKGLTICRPTPIVPISADQGKNLDESDEISNMVNFKINLSPCHSDSKSEFSPRSKSNTCSTRDSDSDSNGGDVESVESDTVIKSHPLDFPFEGGEVLSLEVGKGITNITHGNDESYCKISLEDQQEAQEPINSDYALVGASGASVDDKWQISDQKRVLSCNTLSALNQEAGCDTVHLKKTRLSKQLSKVVCAIPEIPLAIEALDEIIQPLPRQYLIRDDFLLIPSSSDEEEDNLLSEELEIFFRNKGCSVSNFPIPLLTPPQSPRTVDNSVEDQAMSSIEWPSNLVMDSAIIMSFANISPLSTISPRDEKFNFDDSAGESVKGSLATRVRTVSIETPWQPTGAKD